MKSIYQLLCGRTILSLFFITLIMSPFFLSHEASAADKAVEVQLETNLGIIKVELNPVAAPKSVENFLSYVDSGFFDNTIFHRVIKTFMIQGGGFTPEMTKKKTKAPIINEADNGLKNLKGTIAMARTNAPHSASSQFFINTVDNAFLDHKNKSQRGWGYCVFGKVVSGMDVVDAIAAQPTTVQGMQQNMPQKTVLIIKASRVVEKSKE